MLIGNIIQNPPKFVRNRTLELGILKTVKIHISGLLEPFISQIWISVWGWGRILGVGSCAFDLDSKAGGGSFRRSLIHQQTLNGVSAVVTNFQMLGKTFWTPLKH